MPPAKDSPRSERRTERQPTARARAAEQAKRDEEDAQRQREADASKRAEAEQREREEADAQKAKAAQEEAARAAAEKPADPEPLPPPHRATAADPGDPEPEPQVVTDGRAVIAGLNDLLAKVSPDVRRLFPELAEVFNAYQGQLPSIDERFKRVVARYARR